jgi:hypothetical protein
MFLEAYLNYYFLTEQAYANRLTHVDSLNR